MKYHLPPIVPPWSYYVSPGFSPQAYSLKQGGDAIFGMVFRWLGDAPVEGEANARAIAAVPALLHALVECEAALHARHVSTGINAGDYSAMQSARIALELAGCVPVAGCRPASSTGGRHVADSMQVVRS